MTDRSKDIEVVYFKAGNKVAEGKVGTGSAAVTGLAPGTVVADGDYKVTFKDSVTGLESTKVDVKGWTVLAPAPSQPAQAPSAVEENLLLKADTPFSMTGNNTANQYQQMYALSRRLEKGTKVTLNFDAVSTAPTKFIVQTDGTDGGTWTNFIADTADTKKKHYEATVTLDDFSEKGINLRLDNIPSTSTVTISNMKLELGSHATA
ncbi:hypothetical protein FD29_GL002043 [Companilactobacillus mindensis DSM 14500]|uniref:Uncharacterized protein n=1 Tax=Companilactobacillus mindensis DSM 14500 TaxID=1423770 RepID=A0A0R1QJ56_9LACO|nr:hypothetical protein [Companilactobacillus mindensis]KRL44617.1 hypothetical protein FD29_GL002043 [Companilactobacillus mindensis DSM 14500]GEO78521.1 hypothetical protein LMI01_08520 [Companilactobacillus mindensis]